MRYANGLNAIGKAYDNAAKSEANAEAWKNWRNIKSNQITMPPIFSLPLSPYMREDEYTEVYLPFSVLEMQCVR